MLRSVNLDASALAVDGLTGAPVTVTAGLISFPVERFDGWPVDFFVLSVPADRLIADRTLTENKWKRH